MEQNTLVRKLGLVLAVFVFLLPVFFVPAFGVSLYVAKVTLLATGLVVLFAVFLSSVLSTGNIEVPKAKYLIPLVLFAVVALVSSALSGAIGNSISGSIFELGTSGSLLMLVFVTFLTMIAARSVGIVTRVLQAFIFSTIILALYTILGTFGVSLVPTALASKIPLFLLGGVIDTSIVFGVAVILSLCALNMTEISKRIKIILSVLIVYSMMFLGAANFMPAVIILGVISLVFFVYNLSWSAGTPATDGTGSNRKVSLSSLAILLASVVLLLGGTALGGSLSRAMRVQSIEVRPNFQTTMDLTLSAWQKNFVFGIGPNRFVEFWNLHKPAEINQTQFWNTDFYSGSGFVPTIAITTGLLGLLSLLAFIVLYLVSGIKAMFAQANALRSRYLATSSFLASLYLWAMLFIYTPSITVLALAFIFTGLFTATLVSQGIVSFWNINIFSNPKTNFLSVLSIVILLIISIAGGYFVWAKAAAVVTFENGVAAYQTTGNIAAMRESTARAISIAPSDIYWRGLAEASLSEVGRIAAGAVSPDKLSEADKASLQQAISDTVEAAKQASVWNSANYQNWFALGRVYEVLATNGIGGAFEASGPAFLEAQKRAPTNPAIPLALARLQMLSGKPVEARSLITESIKLKSNYTDAYFTLAQLEAAENNIPATIRSVEQAYFLDQQNIGLLFQLGLLKYNISDFRGAASALERAVSAVPTYANARYFLGLSYERLGRRPEATLQFEEIAKTNPDNQEISFILSNLKAGKSPFKDAVPPVDDKPEKRSEPPINE